MNIRFTLAAAASLAASLTALADVKVNDHLSINGYAVGSWTRTNPDNGKSSETFLKSNTFIGNTDAVKMGVLAASGPVSAYGSILYIPSAGSTNEAGLLDAYATYDFGSGVKLTGGKFLSYLGYEAFDAVNMAQLTYGYTIFAVPAYHSGARLDYTGKTFTAGLAVVDSIFSGRKGFFEGDREFSDDLGLEAIFTYTGMKDVTVFAGIASENTDKSTNEVFIFNLWASYAITPKVTIAGEFITQDDGGDGWLAFLSYKFDSKFSTAFRISTDRRDAGGSDQKYTVAPTFTVSPNLSFRGEFSLGRGDNYGDYKFFGVQAVLKF